MASYTHTSPPAKRQKTDGGYSTGTSANQAPAYNSDEDSGDDLFNDFIPDTPGAGRHETQPTQILDRPLFSSTRIPSPPTHFDSEVQVPASSPLSAKYTPIHKPVANGFQQNGFLSQKRSLATSMAPAGTAFKPPPGITQKPTALTKPTKVDDEPITIDDDSDDEISEVYNDIKPTTFYKSARSSFNDPAPQSSIGNSMFQHIVSNAAFKPGMQTRPERAQPVGNDMRLEDCGDQALRERVARLRTIYPHKTVMMCRNALVANRANVDAAATMLALEGAELANAGDPLPQAQMKKPEPIQMKRIIEAPLASLKDRYNSTQGPAPRYADMATPPPKKKKLVQGRRHPSSPAAPAAFSPFKPQPSPVISLDDFDSEDSGNVSIEEDDPELEDRVLKFLNKCTLDELIELTSTTKPYAQLMIESRPFRSCDAARCVENHTKTKAGKKSNRAPIGEKIVDTAMNMFTGYEAIDALVSKCKELGKPLNEEMASWGFDVFGAAKSGELEMTSFEGANTSPKDSGIGSPSSGAASLNDDADDDVKVVSAVRKKNINFIKQPDMMPTDDVSLKDYQVVGLNWLALMYRQKLSGILADEMGLGKTCQVIALLSHLVETGHPGPHLVICPGSTLENWLREIPRFSPELAVEVYYGLQKERAEMAESILERRNEINVVVTTYDLATKPEDNKFLRRLKPDVCVYDEGHYLKNIKSLRYAQLVKIPAKFKLLLTGTPLQNNLQELVSLLAFILPDVFAERQEDLEFIFKSKATTRDTDHAALLSAQRIDRARSMLTPFVLRRKKQQVLKHLPSKTCRLEYCTITSAQQKIYEGLRDSALERARIRIEGGKFPKSETEENNPLMQLRKAAIHPLLFRRHFSDAKIEKMADILRKKDPANFPTDKLHARHHLVGEMQSLNDYVLHKWCMIYPSISSFDIPDLAWMDSGKVEAMMKLVKQYKENGDRVLIFSQFALLLDILEAVLNSSMVHFTRIDGSTKIDERQTLIDTFRDDESITVFLLTTKAGGTGINLMFANKVIIFDSSFNPQDDKQAENRAHRVGQTRDVEVVRLVTSDTIEEQIYALGVSKLTLDGRVAGDDAAAEEAGMKSVAKMFLEGVKAADVGPVTEGVSIEKKDGKMEGKVDETAKKQDTTSKRKRSSILDTMLTKTKSSAPTQESDIVEVDDEDSTTFSTGTYVRQGV